MSRYWVTTQAGGDVWQVDSSFPDADVVGNAMYEATQQAVVDHAFEALATGGPAHFGAITLRPGALMVGKTTIPLTDGTDISIAKGELHIVAPGRMTVAVPVRGVANLPALMTLLNDRSRLIQIGIDTAAHPNP